jgi:hypothetical protein
MVQYLRRGTKFDFAGARHTLHKKRCKAGLSCKKLTDKDLLKHLEDVHGYLGHKGVLEHRLKKSWQIHKDDGACFRILEADLVAVTNLADNTVVTILTKEIAQKKIPFDLNETFEAYMAALASQASNSIKLLNENAPVHPSVGPLSATH